jgi:LemA protein
VIVVAITRVFFRELDMKHSGKAGSLVAVVLLGLLSLVLLLGVVLFGWYKAGYNRSVRLEQAAQEAWANVDAQLQRRLDLVPNLVETVKGYATHESQLFESISQARTKYFQADTTAGKIQASNELTGLLSRLLVLREAYPELKANQNFLALQDQLEGTENRIAVARTRYNEAAKELNTYTRELFGSFFTKRAGVEPKPYFEAAEGARQAPKVDFSTTPPPAPKPGQ